MPTNTTNFSLIKPGQEEFYNVDVPNANMDTIDGVLKALQDAISSGVSEQDLKEVRDALAMHLTVMASPTEGGHVQLSNLYNGTSDKKAVTEKALNDFRLFLAKMGFAESGQAVANDTDIDTLTKQGLYKIGTTAGNINVAKGLPSGTYHLLVMADATTVVQLFVGINVENANKILHRTRNAGAWSSMVTGLDSSMRNVANGFVGLDGNGNLPASLGVENYKLLYSVDFASNPIHSVEVGNLSGYKKLRLIGKKLKSIDPNGRNIYIYINGIPYNAPSSYTGSTMVNGQFTSAAGVIPGVSVGGPVASQTSTAEFIVDLESIINVAPKFQGYSQALNYAGNTQGAYFTFGSFVNGGLTTSTINSVTLLLYLSSGVERFTSGTYEIWGVPR
ncbi:pyocin knob domain-containing protein [Psychrobacillus psychrodurans]|uniref:pyocin knob domain-containing protein n=1 Tax=Psychrobacillus psychrodurans TaxID=126157 RepID=UPI001F4F0EC3|nr:pyocin knob domain-containing protein [Psychrobacillus psychrodurans]MCK1998936.1 pyocin knob domain-containing protein [Psychrobacillus psychrodurans]